VLSSEIFIVGCGYAGSVLAERLASQSGLHCLVVDRRAHIGGNSYDEHDASGLLIHKYARLGLAGHRFAAERGIPFVSQIAPRGEILRRLRSTATV
jgi:choline dehydrogenase-like flavoprotein